MLALRLGGVSEENHMIVRMWRGRAAKHRPDDYKRHFEKLVLPELHALPGFLGAMLLRREVAEGFEFLVVSQWESLDAVKVFAGDNYERAVVDPGAAATLETFDKTVSHYEVLSRSAT
jgi:heme-degrading monooxygenase HmoA